MASKPPEDKGVTDLEPTAAAATAETIAQTVGELVGAADSVADTIAVNDAADTAPASPRARLVESADTLVSHGPPGASVPIAAGPDGTLAAQIPRTDSDFAERYRGGELLGRGGMGEVRQYLDSVIGRHVAIKFLRGEALSEESGPRFVREARVQGQLQHPAVVPVYDLGKSNDGATFFTMKRLGGRTMAEIITELRVLKTESEDDHRASLRQKRRQLLTAFSDVCLAVDYAHTRGVVHRDLKPANIMLGDFGEVYVLDWGLARLADDTDGPPPKLPPDSGPIAFAAGVTQAKTVMGTVGYMSPEQLKGEPIGAAADVYALGAMLFEILTLEPLHHGATTAVMAMSTLTGVAERIAERAAAHDLPPELAELCVAAAAVSTNDRLPTARALYDGLEGFLAGDRDLERRRELAEELATSAERAAEIAHEQSDIHARKRAMQEATRALALDPDQRTAARVLMRLLLEPPTEMPDEVREELRQKRIVDNRRHAKLAAAGYGSWLIALPLFLWMGVVDWTLGGAMVASVVLCAAASIVGARRQRVGTLLLVVGAFMNGATLFLLTRLLGPLILVPTLAVSTSLAFTLYGQRVATILGPLTAVVAIIAAVAAEALGWIPVSYTYAAGEMRVLSQVLELRPVATTMTLTALVGAAVLVAAWFVASVRSNLDRAEAANMTMLWQYRQIAL